MFKAVCERFHNSNCCADGFAAGLNQLFNSTTSIRPAARHRPDISGIFGQHHRKSPPTGRPTCPVRSRLIIQAPMKVQRWEWFTQQPLRQCIDPLAPKTAVSVPR
jgi:hypothetical protein